MDAEKRTQTAITITRVLLKSALTSPFTMVTITMDLVKPGDVEDAVYEILCYLEKTKPEKATEGLGIDTIEEGV